MSSVKSLLAILAIAIVGGSQTTAAKNTLQAICNDLSHELSLAKVPFDEAEKVFAFAKSYLKGGLNPLTSSERKRLISAWDNVIHDATCSADSLNEVLVIERCRPWVQLKLRTLEDAFKKYVRKCLTPEFAEKMMIAKSEGQKSNKDFADAKTFIDTEFIRDYRANRPNDIPLHLHGGHPSCCRPEYAITAIMNAINRDLGKSGENAKEKLGGEKKKLSAYLSKHLFGPCRQYKKTLSPLMSGLAGVAIFFETGSEGLVKGMSLEAQEDVFRYKFCQNMQFDVQREFVVEQLFYRLEATL